MILLLCTISTAEIHAQDSLVPAELASQKLRRSLTKDPSTLAAAITEGKITEKEKFDAIFAWVVNNISYDYRLYYSGKANNGNNPLKRVLRRRKGVCTDYAKLMDALCGEVGIDNRTIEGYTKELVFDINDTLYFDNHAWNAVKLNGFWFLYDATWSSGSSVLEYSRLAKWRLNQIEKLRKKVKTKKVKLYSKGRKNRLCGEVDNRELGSIDVTRVKFIPRVLSDLLFWPPFRVKEVYRRVVNTNYYLTQPEVFAIDHFPTNAIWSLQDELSSVADFSADSAFFYKSRMDYTNQQREGRFCLKCDEVFTKDEVGREKYKIEMSRENNPKNHLVPANAYLAIAEIFSRQFFLENDSLAKMALYDSTKYYLGLSRVDYRNSRRDNAMNMRFQRKKNLGKKVGLLRENKQHIKLISSELRKTKGRHIKFKSTATKIRGYLKKGQRDFHNLNRAFIPKTGGKTIKKEREQQIRIKLAESQQASDSLSNLIHALKDSLDIHAPLLWSNLIFELDAFDPLLSLFWSDSWERVVHLNDHQDRTIQQIRALMIEQESVIQNRIEVSILKLADTTYVEFIQLNHLIKKRNATDIRSARLIATLVAGNVMSNDSLKLLKSEFGARLKEDVCWNFNNQDVFAGIEQNFYEFERRNKNFARAIKNNDKAERNRAKYFDKYNALNSRRVNKVIIGNNRIVSAQRKNINKHRQAYLNKLKKERIKAGR